jgi:hypothetical protein
MSTELNGIIEKLTALRDDRDTLAGQLADLRADAKRFCEERDAARAELATYRALMPEVRQLALMAKDCVDDRVSQSEFVATWDNYFTLTSLDVLLAKLPPEQPVEQPATAEPKPVIHCNHSGSTVCGECRDATAEPKRVREWRNETEGGLYWAEYRWDGDSMWFRSDRGHGWLATDRTISQVASLRSYRETTPQPAKLKPTPPATIEPKQYDDGKGGKVTTTLIAETTPQPAPVAGNVPLTLVGPASLNGKTAKLWVDDCRWATVEVRAC